MKDERNIDVKKPGLFKKIVNFFKRIFSKNGRNEKIALPKAENTNERKSNKLSVGNKEISEYDFYQQLENIGYQFEKQEVIKGDESTDKNEFFELYKDFKANKISIDEIDNDDLIKINAMLNSELKIRKDALTGEKS